MTDSPEIPFDIMDAAHEVFGNTPATVKAAKLILAERKRRDQRDEFAKAALSAVIMVCTRDTERTGLYEDYCAERSYAFADAMLKARSHPTPSSPSEMEQRA